MVGRHDERLTTSIELLHGSVECHSSSNRLCSSQSRSSSGSRNYGLKIGVCSSSFENSTVNKGGSRGGQDELGEEHVWIHSGFEEMIESAVKGAETIFERGVCFFLYNGLDDE